MSKLWEFPSQKALKQGAQDISVRKQPAHPPTANAATLPPLHLFILPRIKFSETQRVQAFSASFGGMHKQFRRVNASAFYALSYSR